MTRAAALTMAAAFMTAAADGCNGYSDTPTRPEHSMQLEFRPLFRAAPPASAIQHPAPAKSTTPDASTPPITQPVPTQPMPSPEPMNMKPQPAPTQPMPNDEDANIRLAQSEAFDGYLTDGAGQALYMFVGDVAGARETACLGTCARDWPPFDVLEAKPASTIDAEAIARFHRQDGAWQTTYHGYGLYYRASEQLTHAVTGDGVDQRWFVARDYLAFMASSRAFTPAGGMEVTDSFLTDGFGRTLYVCLDDDPGTLNTEPIASCDGECLIKRPIFGASETSRTTLLPSVLQANALNELVRLDGSVQLTYRGWPLYYFTGDILVGSTEGHNDQAWRAFDPILFGRDPTTDSGP